ncbi:MAG: hypothetical protein SGI90_15675 [Candidatus Eisenbacteria bacterium]|nr:hypothetical protein [Candidatus Eisenbacteria bacterium]
MYFKSRSMPPFLVSVVALLLAGNIHPALAADEMTVAKDTIRIKVTARSCTMNDEACKGTDLILYPEISCHLNGELPSGATPWVEFRAAGKPPLRQDAALDDVWGHENRWAINCGSVVSSNHGFIYPGKIPAGTIEFSIGIRNELTETNSVIYEGKLQYEKMLVSPGDESTADLLVNDDWRLPIGYLYMSDRGLHVVTWYRGRPGGVRTYLFLNGKEVAQNEGCGIGDVKDFDPTHRMYWEVDCELIGVYGNAETAASGYEPNYDLSKNPGAYEVKCLAGGKLARVVKFTVNPDGSFDNGLATANKLGTDRVIVPVEVRLDVPPWNKAAWKTEAYYGHPLTGFVAPQ